MSLCCFVANDLSFSKLSMWGDASFSKTAAFYCTGSTRGENSDFMIIHQSPPCCSGGSLKKNKSTLLMPMFVGLCCHSGCVTSLCDAGAWPTATGLAQRAFESGRLSALLISSVWENLKDNLAGGMWLPSSPPTLVLVRAAVLGWCISVLWIIWVSEHLCGLRVLWITLCLGRRPVNPPSHFGNSKP